jgi:hypothetical protein
LLTITVGESVLHLEHSLASLSKWEAMFQKPFLSSEKKTTEETIGYIRCMCLDDEAEDDVFEKLSADNMLRINTYLEAPMTATTFRLPPGPPKTREIITAELIYYWMTIFNIPFECEHWHLNRLFTLIKVCNIKSSKPKKMSRSELAEWQRSQNAARRAALGSRG